MADAPLTLTSTLGFFYEEKLPILRQFITIFFPNLFTTEQNQIQVDRYLRGRKRANYRPIGGASNLLSMTEGKGIMYQPPAIGLKTPVNEDMAGTVAAGVSANTSQNEHLTKKYAMIQAEQSEDIWTEIVLQAIDVMREGKFTAKTAEGSEVGEFDYGRDAANSITYDVGVKGGMAWLTEAYNQMVAKRAPRQNLVCIAGSQFINALENDADFKKYVDQVWYQTTDGLQAGRPYNDSEILTILTVIKIPNTTRKVTIMSFDETYDNAGNETEMFPTDEAVITSMNSQRTAAFAGIFITDPSTNSGTTYEGEVVTDRYVNNDPDALYIRSQSRPLLIPANVDHIVRVAGTNF